MEGVCKKTYRLALQPREELALPAFGHRHGRPLETLCFGCRWYNRLDQNALVVVKSVSRVARPRNAPTCETHLNSHRQSADTPGKTIAVRTSNDSHTGHEHNLTRSHSTPSSLPCHLLVVPDSKDIWRARKFVRKSEDWAAQNYTQIIMSLPVIRITFSTTRRKTIPHLSMSHATLKLCSCATVVGEKMPHGETRGKDT